MAASFPTLVMHEARLQFRYGIYIAYGFVVAFYILALVYGGPYLPSWVPGLIIFTDPAALGFFFLGALMMLEKGENTRNALGVTPITAPQYFWAKSIMLTGVSLVAVLILVPFLHQGANLPMLLAIVALTSVSFLGIGIPAALHFKSVTSYLIGAIGYLVPIIGPGFIALIDPMPIWAIFIPTAAQFKLILIATDAGSATTTEIAGMFAVAILAAIGSVWLAYRSLKKELGDK